MAVVRALLEAYPFAAKAKDIRGQLPLHYAARYRGRAKAVRALLEVH